MGMGSNGGYILILWRRGGGKRGREGGWTDCSDAALRALTEPM
jgi:hypothetical protein